MSTPRLKTVSNLREVVYGDLRAYYATLTVEADRVAREIAYRDQFRESVAAGRTPSRYVSKPLHEIPTTIRPVTRREPGAGLIAASIGGAVILAIIAAGILTGRGLL